MDNLLLVFAIVGFLAIVLLVEGAYLLWNSTRGAEAKRMRERLQVLSAGDKLSAESLVVKQRLLSDSPVFERLLLQMPRVHSLDRLLLQAGQKRTVAGFLALAGGFGLAGLMAWMLLDLPLWTLPVCALGAGVVPFARLLSTRRRRLRTLERQLPEALDLMSRALRAGHAFPSALQMVGDEGPEPISGEFRTTFDEVNYGVPMHDALANLAARVPVTDLRFFVIAVAIQRETGGNLTELLDKLAALMRARFKLLGTIRVLSAEGRLSAWILSALPFAVAGLVNLINPKFMSILWTDPAGLVAASIGLTMMLIGIVVLWRMVKIRV